MKFVHAYFVLDIFECISNPCVHGECLDDLSFYRCACDDGYTGWNCDVDIDECLSSPCTDHQCEDQISPLNQDSFRKGNQAIQGDVPKALRISKTAN